MLNLLLSLVILVTPVTIAQGRSSNQDERITTVYKIKPGDTKYSLDRQFCTTNFPTDIKAGQNYLVEYDIDKIMSVYILHSQKYQMVDKELLHVLMANVIREGLPPCLALAIAIQESGLKQRAVSPGGDVGLFQVNQIHFDEYDVTKKQMKSFRHNIPVALHILNKKDAQYNRADWWVTYNTGSKFSLLKCKDNGCNKKVDVALDYKNRINRILNDIRATQLKLMNKG